MTETSEKMQRTSPVTFTDAVAIVAAMEPNERKEWSNKTRSEARKFLLSKLTGNSYLSVAKAEEVFNYCGVTLRPWRKNKPVSVPTDIPVTAANLAKITRDLVRSLAKRIDMSGNQGFQQSMAELNAFVKQASAMDGVVVTSQNEATTPPAGQSAVQLPLLDHQGASAQVQPPNVNPFEAGRQRPVPLDTTHAPPFISGNE